MFIHTWYISVFTSSILCFVSFIKLSMCIWSLLVVLQVLSLLTTKEFELDKGNKRCKIMQMRQKFSNIWKTSTVRLSSSLDTRHRIDFSFQYHPCEVDLSVRSNEMRVLLKNGMFADLIQEKIKFQIFLVSVWFFCFLTTLSFGLIMPKFRLTFEPFLN